MEGPYHHPLRKKSVIHVCSYERPCTSLDGKISVPLEVYPKEYKIAQIVDDVEKRVDNVDRRITVTKRFHDIEKRVDIVKERVAAFENRVDVVEKRIDAVNVESGAVDKTGDDVVQHPSSSTDKTKKRPLVKKISNYLKLLKCIRDIKESLDKNQGPQEEHFTRGYNVCLEDERKLITKMCRREAMENKVGTVTVQQEDQLKIIIHKLLRGEEIEYTVGTDQTRQTRNVDKTSTDSPTIQKKSNMKRKTQDDKRKVIISRDCRREEFEYDVQEGKRIKTKRIFRSEGINYYVGTFQKGKSEMIIKESCKGQGNEDDFGTLQKGKSEMITKESCKGEGIEDDFGTLQKGESEMIMKESYKGEGIEDDFGTLQEDERNIIIKTICRREGIEYDVGTFQGAMAFQNGLVDRLIGDYYNIEQENIQPPEHSEQELEDMWDGVSGELSAILQGRGEIPQDVSPFDAASEVQEEQQIIDAMIMIQDAMKDKESGRAIALLRSAREIWPERDEFGSQDISAEDEFMAMREIFLANLPQETRNVEWRHFLIWSLLVPCKDLAMAIWSTLKRQDKIPTAFFAATLVKQISRKSEVNQEDLLNLSGHFHREVFEDMNEADWTEAWQRTSKALGNTTMLHIAFENYKTESLCEDLKKNDSATKEFYKIINGIKTLLDNDAYPSRTDFREGYKHLMDDDPNLMVKICRKENQYSDRHAATSNYQKVMQLQATLVQRLIGDFYNAPKASFDEPEWKHFFIWSLLVPIKGLAMDIWHKLDTQDRVPAALFAATLLKAMSTKLDDKGEDKCQKDYLLKWSEHFTDKTIQQMEKAYQENERDAWNTLEENFKTWGNISILTLAVDSKNKKFLEQKFCRTLFEIRKGKPEDITTIQELSTRIINICSFGEVPEAGYFETGYKLLMGDEDNLIREICSNYYIGYQEDDKYAFKKMFTNQRDLVQYLIKHDYAEGSRDEPELIDFFIWTLFVQRQNREDNSDIESESTEPIPYEDVSMKIWGKLTKEDKIYAALLAAHLLKAMSDESDHEKEEFLEMSRKFSEKASKFIKETYKKDQAHKILKEKSKTGPKVSLLKFAATSKNLDFLDQPYCKSLLKDEWYGKLSSTMSIERKRIGNQWCTISTNWTVICLFVVFTTKLKKNIVYQLFCTCLFIPIVMFLPKLFLKYRQPLSDTNPKKDWRKKLEKKTRRYFVEAPIIRFLIHGITYAGFLGYFSYVLLIQFSAEFTFDDFLLLYFVTSICIDDLMRKAGQYMKGKIGCCNTNHKNCCQNIYYVGKWFFQNVKSLFTSKGIWTTLNVSSMIFFIIGYTFKSTHIDAARIILGFDLILLYLRALEIFLIHPNLGPKILMIGNMLRDLFYFMLVLMIFVISYGIAAHSIMYPNSELNFKFVLNLLKRAYWNLYGELFLEELEQQEPYCTFDKDLYSTDVLPRCPTASSTVWIPIMMGLYILVSNILLLNLLIAMFSGTFERIQEDSDRLWNYQRYFLIQEYKTRIWIPLALPYYIYRIHKYLKKEGLCCCYIKSETAGVKPEQHTGQKTNQPETTPTFRDQTIKPEQDTGQKTNQPETTSTLNDQTV